MNGLVLIGSVGVVNGCLAGRIGSVYIRLLTSGLICSNCLKCSLWAAKTLMVNLHGQRSSPTFDPLLCNIHGKPSFTRGE